MRRRRFEALVWNALATLPPDIRAMLDNVAITVEDWPTPEELASVGLSPEHTLLGLYVGVPLTERGSGYSMALPDKVILYQGPLEALAPTHRALSEQVRATVIHELAHHFGISDARLVELGWG
jgi:predicted Zn-dependent protease with MMP-like domain